MSLAGPQQSGQAFHVEYQHGIAIVALSASPDSKALSSLRQSVEDWLSRSWRFILVDLELLRFVDSSTAECLAGISRMVKSRGGVLALLKPQHTVIVFLRNNGYLDLFPVYKDRVTAIKELCGAARLNDAAKQGSDGNRMPSKDSTREIELRRMLENNGSVLAAIAKTLHSKGVLSNEDMQTLFG